MKRGVLAVLAFVAIAGAPPALAEIKVEGSVYAGVFDKYLWRGYDLSGSTPVAQGGMDLSFNNLTLGYWTNAQFKDDSADWDPAVTYQGGDANETDLSINYAADLGELVSLNVGNLYYTFDGANDTNEAYVKVALNTLLNPELAVYYDWDENKDSRTYALSVGHSLDLGKVTVNAGALANYLEGTDPTFQLETNVPWNAELSLSADLAVTEQITVTPSFVYSTPLSEDAQRVVDTEMASGLTVSLSF